MAVRSDNVNNTSNFSVSELTVEDSVFDTRSCLVLPGLVVDNFIYHSDNPPFAREIIS